MSALIATIELAPTQELAYVDELLERVRDTYLEEGFTNVVLEPTDELRVYRVLADTSLEARP